MPGHKVTTYASHQVAFDKDLMVSMTGGEPEYYILCASPSVRWLLLTLLEFYAIFQKRWWNWSGFREIDQLHAEALQALTCPMTCAEDFQALVAEVVTLNGTMVEIRDRLGDEDGDLDARLTEIKTELDELAIVVASLDTSSLYDQVEEVLNGVGVILGAPSLPILP